MKLQNKSKHPYQHTLLDNRNGVKTITLNAGEIKDIPDDIAKVWIKLGECVEFVEPDEAKELKAEIEKLKAENEKLKTPAKEAKPQAKVTKKAKKK